MAETFLQLSIQHTDEKGYQMKMVTQPAFVIALSTLAAILLAADGIWCQVAGIGLVMVLIGAALISFWLGLLALLPMLFAIDPAPPSISFTEAAFALLAATSMLGSLAEEVRDGGWGAPVRRYRWPAAVALVWSLLNLYMARQNGVPIGDWARGIVPFLFLIFALPFAHALAERPERLKWVGLSIAAYTLLLMGSIVGYYIVGEFYKPYWIVGEGNSWLRITAEQLPQYPEALGPYTDRITMVLTRSTTVLMGAGLTMAFVAATLAGSWRVRLLAGVLAALCLTAELLTYTRSMLLVSGLTIACFIILLVLRNRQRLGRALAVLLLLVGWGGATIWLFNMGTMWNYRISVTMQAIPGEAEKKPDENITSRLQEIFVAWERFKQHPILGNGLGVKNPMVYIGPEGPFEMQVAYIHNWFFYALMVGGILGWGLFAFLLFGPILSRWREAGKDLPAYDVARFGMLSFAVYGLAFAVFRHIDFNILMATAWGVTLAARAETKA